MKPSRDSRRSSGRPLLLGATALYVAVLYLFYRGILPQAFLLTNFFYGVLLCAAFICSARRREWEAVPLLSWDLAAAALAAALSFLRQWSMIGRSWAALACGVAAFFACWPLLWGVKCALRRLAGQIAAPGVDAAKSAGRRAGWLAFLCTLAVLLLMWTTAFPYHTSPDTRYQWAQIHGEFPYNDVHSFGHTLLLRALLSVVDNYAFVVLVQILLVAALYAAFAAYLARRGAPLPALLVLCAVFASSKLVVSTVTSPWKDVPYALCLGAVTLLAMRWVEAPDSFSGRGAWRCAALGLALAGAFLMRQNGVVVLLFLGGYFLIALLRRRMLRGGIAMVAAAAVAIVGVNVCAYRALGVQSRGDNGFPYQVFASGIAAVVNDPNTTGAELERIDSVLPVDWMQENYPAWQHRYLIWNRDAWSESIDAAAPEAVFNNRFVTQVGERHWEVVRLYFELLPRHFAACARDVLENTAAIWGHAHLSVLAFDNISLLLALFLAFALGGRRRGDLLVCAPVLLNALSIAISAITNEERYLLPTTLLFPALLLYALTRREKTPPAAGTGNSRCARRLRSLT